MPVGKQIETTTEALLIHRPAHVVLLYDPTNESVCRNAALLVERRAELGLCSVTAVPLGHDGRWLDGPPIWVPWEQISVDLAAGTKAMALQLLHAGAKHVWVGQRNRPRSCLRTRQEAPGVDGIEALLSFRPGVVDVRSTPALDPVAAALLAALRDLLGAAGTTWPSAGYDSRLAPAAATARDPFARAYRDWRETRPVPDGQHTFGALFEWACRAQLVRQLGTPVYAVVHGATRANAGHVAAEHSGPRSAAAAPGGSPMVATHTEVDAVLQLPDGLRCVVECKAARFSPGLIDRTEAQVLSATHRLFGRQALPVIVIAHDHVIAGDAGESALGRLLAASPLRDDGPLWLTFEALFRHDLPQLLGRAAASRNLGRGPR